MADHEPDVVRRDAPVRQDAGGPRDAGAGPRHAGAGPRDAEGRRADHEAIDRLTEELLPSLIAKLGATGLGEIEVREDDWKVRLRRPSDANGPQYGRRATDRPSRAQPGHAGHGHAPGVVEPRSRPVGAATGGPSVVGSGIGASSGRGLTPVGPGPATSGGAGAGGALSVGGSGADDERQRAVATSPAVGVFQPRPEATAGKRVRAGDRIGIVDVLGVPQEVVAPVDGIIGASYVQAGEAVEYGQDLIRIELPVQRPSDSSADPATSAPGPEEA